MVAHQSVYYFCHRGVLGEEQHQVARKLETVAYYFIKVGINVVKAILREHLIPTATPRWAQKHAVKARLTR